MQRLLASAVADPSVGVRRTILQALVSAEALDMHLAQAETLRSLFVALNDESSAVRSLAIRLAGHISAANPAYVMPALRRHLMQLLSDMDHSPDSRQREGMCAGRALAAYAPVRGRAADACGASNTRALLLMRHVRVRCTPLAAESAKLLGVLINAAPQLVLPYTAPILKALISKMRSPGSGTAALPTLPPAATVAAVAPGGQTQGKCQADASGAPLLCWTLQRSSSPPPSRCAEDLNGFEVAILSTMGKLAHVAGQQLHPSVPEILPLIIDAVQDGGSPGKRLVAVTTLGQVVESTGTGARACGTVSRARQGG